MQKGVSTALRKLKRENPGLGKKGKLTDGTIDKLQNYHGIVIRSNVGNSTGMKKAIHASAPPKKFTSVERWASTMLLHIPIWALLLLHFEAF